MADHKTLLSYIGKTICILALWLGACTGALAQKEIWGTVSGNSLAIGQGDRYGYLYKTDSVGNNFTIMYEFDSLHGKNPGQITVGSNGKIYGLTGSGGTGNHVVQGSNNPNAANGGVFYEYDPVLDSLRVIYNFNVDNVAFPYDWPTSYAPIEVSPGVFYGTLYSYGRYVFKCTVATGTASLVTTIPNFNGGTMNSNQFNYIYGGLMKASNGFVYAATLANSACPIAVPNGGSLVRINPANNALSTVYLNPCVFTDGTNYGSPNLEYNGKLYSTAHGGLGAGSTYLYPGYGVVYEFNPATNVYTKKANFLGGVGGQDPSTLIKGANGKFYGTANGGSPYTSPYASYPNGSGIIFEFDPANNNLNPVHEFRSNSLASDEGEYGNLTLAASNGKLYGISTTGMYEYDPMADHTEQRARVDYTFNAQNLVEICRKPSYTLASTNTLAVCAGTPFVYDLHNDNATTVTWLHNGAVDPTRTSAKLEFDPVVAANAGTWTCTLSNACGTSTPPTLTLTVNAAGAGTVTSTITPAGPLMICPDGSTLLSGNNGGTWSTGATTPTLTVTTPGQYQVTNTNTCGHTYSNIVTVDTIPSPPVPVAEILSSTLCQGGTMILGGNTAGGTWNTGATTATITVPVATGVPYYITRTHGCGTDTSNTVQIYPNSIVSTVGTPNISANGPLTFCNGGGVTLGANADSNPNAIWSWSILDENYQYIGSSGANVPITATQSGIYVLTMNLSPCGIIRHDTAIVTVETLPAPTVTASGPTNFCAGGSVQLQSNLPGGHWSNGVTADSLTATQSGTYNATYANSCGSVTTANINVTVVPPPTVSYTQPITLACTSGGVVPLTGGSPAGGTYTGPGVSGSSFAPWIAGAGTHTISYTYSDGTCPATATQQIVVSAPQQPLLLSGNASNSFCQGGQLLLFQTQYQLVNWSTGVTDVVLFVNQPGTYSYSVTDGCGTTASNSITVTMNPTSPATNNPQTICAGETYTFNGHAYTASGTYTDSFSNVYGCDSSTITQLTVTPPPNSNNPQTICAGSSYVFNGHTYTAAGNYTDTFQSMNGCDSTVTTQLSVTPAPNSNNPQTICAGESYIFNGHTYGSAGNYTDTFQSINGCDSTVTTQLTVHAAPTLQNPHSLCEGETYTINGHTYAAAGTYTDVFQTTFGCDSTVLTQITLTHVDLNVAQAGAQLSAAQPAATYQWINCATHTPIAGATQQTYTATANGSYAVQVTVNGCSDTSACYTVNNASVQEWAAQGDFSLFPNPSTDVVWLQSGSPIRRVRVYNTLGQEVMATTSSNKLDVATLAPGTYFVTAQTDAGMHRAKFIKQ